MNRQNRIVTSLVGVTMASIAVVAAAQSPAPPAAVKPNQDTATATLLAECVKKEQGRSEGTTRAAATDTCKKRLTTEPVTAPLPGESPKPARQEDVSSEIK